MPLRPILSQWTQFHCLLGHWTATWSTICHSATPMPLEPLNCHSINRLEFEGPCLYSTASISKSANRSLPFIKGSVRLADLDMISQNMPLSNPVSLCHWNATQTNPMSMDMVYWSIMPLDYHFANSVPLHHLTATQTTGVSLGSRSPICHLKTG